MDVVEKRCDYRIQMRGEETACGESVPRNIGTQFAVAPNSYKADLCVNHQNDLAAVLAPFSRIAQTSRAITSVNTRGRKVMLDKTGRKYTAKDERAWAKQEGIEVSDEGHVSNSVSAAYAKAHGDKK